MKQLQHIITVFLALCAFPFSSFGITYYFSTSGSDNNNGLTPSMPKQTIAAARAVMMNGNTILFNRGDIWYIPMDTLSLSGKKNITIGAYGSAAKPRPVIAGMATLTKWTYTGSNNIWKCAIAPYIRVHRLWADDIALINLEHKNGKNNSFSDLTSVTEYYIENANTKSATIYLKTNSSSVPPKNVAIITGTFPVNNLRIATINNSSNITIKNIEFRGGGGEVIMVLAPATNIIFDSCKIGYALLHGLVVMSHSGSTDVVKNIQILNCVIDKNWTKAQNDIKNSIRFTSTINGDGIVMWGGVDGGLIKGNYVTNWGHTGISLTSYQDNTQANFGIQHVKVEQNESVAGNSTYMHAFGMTGMEGKVKFNIIKRNYFHDYSAGCTIGGNNNFIFSNIFANVTTSPHAKAKKLPWGVNLSSWEVLPGSGKPYVAKDNFIVNNTFYNIATHAIMASQSYKPGADTLYIDNNKIFNNLMLDFGADTVSNLPKRRNSVAIYWTQGVARGRNEIRNNNFWRKNDTSATRFVVQYSNKLYPVSKFNGCAPCGPSKTTGNVSLNPRFKAGGFFQLSRYASPTLRSGGYKCASIITAHGLPAKEFVDYNGVPWPINPAIGAVQYIAP